MNESKGIQGEPGETGKQGIQGVPGPIVEVPNSAALIELSSSISDMADSNRTLGKDFRDSQPQVKTLTKAIRILIVLMVVNFIGLGLTGWGVIEIRNGQHDSHKTLTAIQDTSKETLSVANFVKAINNPDSPYSKQSAQQLQTLVTTLLSCIENNQLILADELTGKTPPSPLKGCP